MKNDRIVADIDALVAGMRADIDTEFEMNAMILREIYADAIASLQYDPYGKITPEEVARGVDLTIGQFLDRTLPEAEAVEVAQGAPHLEQVMRSKLWAFARWAEDGSIVVIPDRDATSAMRPVGIPLAVFERPWPWGSFMMPTGRDLMPILFAVRMDSKIVFTGVGRLTGDRAIFAAFAVVPMASDQGGSDVEAYIRSMMDDAYIDTDVKFFGDLVASIEDALGLILVLLTDNEADPDREPVKLRDRAAERRRERSGAKAKPVAVGWRLGTWIRAQHARNSHHEGTGAGGTRVAHMRRGHFRVFMGGPGRTELKRTWVKPCRVGEGDPVGRIVKV